MAAKDKEQDNEEKTLSDSQRIAILEKRAKLLMLLTAGLLVLVLLLGGAFSWLLISSDDELPRQNQAAIEQQATQLKAMHDAFQEAKSFALQAKVLQEKVASLLERGQLDNFHSLRIMLLEQEENYRQFLAALKQGTLDMSRMVRGSRTWYDYYAEQIDELIRHSDARERRLRGMVKEEKPVQDSND